MSTPQSSVVPLSAESQWLSIGSRSRQVEYQVRRAGSGMDENVDRELYSADEYNSYLVDRYGEPYEPYSLAWRYLGAYLDCDLEEPEADDEDGERKLGDGNGGGNDCARKVLWAAYVDKQYQGDEIGEYQFYDWSTDTWDTTSCKTRRCARMDCHEPGSHFQLIGVFKEADGFVDWSEQLFKHEGICVWNDDDTYEFMQNYRQAFTTYCTRLSLRDPYGSYLYVHLKPIGEGNITYGIYTDEACSVESRYVSFYDYVVMYFSYYFGADGNNQATAWNQTFQMWNEYMNTFKICQPCRAYNLHSDNENNGRRRLQGQNNGQGDDEMWGYNCYDDAGYTNCNQCFKFETKTEMEQASTEDLERASAQGSILRIRVDGKVYGSGGFGSTVEIHDTATNVVFGTTMTLLTLLAIANLTLAGVALYWSRRYYLMRRTLKLTSQSHLETPFETQSQDAALT